jgi:hypothetical protein
MYKQARRNNTKLILLGLFIVIAAIAVGLYLHNHKSGLNLAANGNTQPVKGTTSAPTAHQTPTNTTSQGGGGVVDQKGQTAGTLPPPSQWASSSSGNITLQQPSANTVVKSGDTLSGLAKVGTVQFILKDNSIGLIAQGTLSVVSGKFSGVLQFTPHSKSGTLEVYYPNPSNGAEEDVVEINVSFNP